MKQPGRVELHNLTGDIGMAGGETTHISADMGVYDTLGESMNLTDNIRIGNSKFDIKLRSAAIDLRPVSTRAPIQSRSMLGPGPPFTPIGPRPVTTDKS